MSVIKNSTNQPLDEEMEGQGEEEKLEDVQTKIQELIEQVNANPYEFPLYQELIEIYRNQGMIDELSDTRQRVQALYCLPEDMWEEWISDEQQLIPQTKEGLLQLLELYEKALKDYKYYKVSRKYCKYILKLNQQGHLDEIQVREKYEPILAIYGLDLNRSGKFWEPYLKFEQAQLEKLKSINASEMEMGKQLSRIRSIFRRRVIFPTSDMLETWQIYKEWETDAEEFKKVQDRHKQAQAQIDGMVSFEEKFQNSMELLENENNMGPILSLLKKDLEVIAGDNFNYIQLYFERILSEYTLNNELWMLYISYMEEKCKKNELKQDLYSRALKNCYYNYEFWIGFMREHEKQGSTSETIQQVGLQAIQSGGVLGGIQFQYQILKAMAEQHVRSILVGPPPAKLDLKDQAILEQVEIARGLYQESIDSLQENHPDEESLHFYVEKIILNWAEVEAYKFNDKKQVQELMETYVKANGHMLMSWANYIKLMRVFPDSEKQMRGLFKRGLQVIKDNKIQLADLWLEWEKKFCTVQTLDQCVKYLKKVDLYEKISQTNIYQRQQQQQQSYAEDQDENIRGERGKKTNQQTKGQQRHNDNNENEEEKQGSEDSRQHKKPRSEATDPHHREPRHTLYISNISLQAVEEDIEFVFGKVLPDVILKSTRLVRDSEGNRLGICYVDVESQEMAERSLKLNNYNIKGQPIVVQISKPPGSGTDDNKTVYVNNLPFTTTEEKLRSHFSTIGPIEEVRLIRNHQGRIKGFCYIQFKEESSVQEAIKQLNKSKFNGRTLSVEKVQSKQEQKEHVGYTVHIKNLSFKVTEDQLRAVCESKFGPLNRVHLVKDDKGESKGFAFVEFKTEDAMEESVKAKEVNINDRVAIFSKSKRQITEQKAEHQKDIEDDNRRKKKREFKSERKQMLTDIKNETAQLNSSTSNETSTSAVVKTNADFKSLLFGKK